MNQRRVAVMEPVIPPIIARATVNITLTIVAIGRALVLARTRLMCAASLAPVIPTTIAHVIVDIRQSPIALCGLVTGLCTQMRKMFAMAMGTARRSKRACVSQNMTDPGAKWTFALMLWTVGTRRL